MSTGRSAIDTVENGLSLIDWHLRGAVMRAVVVVTGKADGGYLMEERYHMATLWLVDRPLIQHICETLVANGVQTIDWVYPHETDSLNHFLGSGRRWGATFNHHISESPSPFPLVRKLLENTNGSGIVLFGHAQRTVTFPTILPGRDCDAGVVMYDCPKSKSWTGWAAFSGGAACRFPALASNLKEIERHLFDGSNDRCERRTLAVGPEIRCFESYMAATRAMLDTISTANGKWQPRSNRVHAKATIIEPVYFGPGSEIAAEATVGPYVVVGPDCIVGRKTTLSNVVVMPETFVGGQVSIAHAVADRDRIISPGPAGLAYVDPHVPVACLTDHLFSRMSLSALADRGKALAKGLGTLSSRLIRKTVRVAPTARDQEMNRPSSPVVGAASV
jgi:hypothetical protein